MRPSAETFIFSTYCKFRYVLYVTIVRILSHYCRIWSHLLKKSVMENFFFCSVFKIYVIFLRLIYFYNEEQAKHAK